MTELIRAVFFDLDDTLIGDGAADAALQVVEDLARRHPELKAEALRAANAEVWSGCWADRGHRWMLGQLEDDELAREVWWRTMESVGASTDLVDEAVRLHLEAERRTFRLFDDTVEVLTELRRRRVTVGVITNGPSTFQRDKLRTVGIDALVDVVVASGDIGVMKPDAQIFLHALGGCEIEARQALHVGDSFEADVVGASGAGIAPVWINRGGLVAPRDDVPHEHGTSLSAVLALVG